MKHLSIYLFGLLFFCSCLDEHPHDQLTEEQAFGDASGLYMNAVATLYNYIGGNADSQGLQGTSQGVYDLCTFTTDEAMLPTRGGDWFDGGLWQELYLHTWTASCMPSGDTWKYLYKVIVLCNLSLERLEKYQYLLHPDQYMLLTSEVRALRCMYYIYLLDLYGRVPYITSTDIDFSQAEQVERKELFDLIYKELMSVQPNLSEKHSNLKGDYYGRITMPVVCFLLAKMNLNAEIWTDNDWTDESRPDGKTIMFDIAGQKLNTWQACIYWCKELERNGYQLEKDEYDNFAVSNESSKENIFVIPMNKNLYTNQFKNLFRSRHYNHGAALGMAAENGTCATISTVKTYGYGTNELDTRFDKNFFAGTVYVDGVQVTLDNGQPLVYEPLEVELDMTGTPYEKTGGARMKKYETDRTALNDGLLQDNDIVLFRYADAVLMMAEAAVRNGDDGSEYLNMIRKRANMPLREATLDNILDERLMELAWEGWRRQDLIRFDRFHLPYDQRPQAPGESNRYTTVFPIPGNVLSLNPNNKQNPGY